VGHEPDDDDLLVANHVQALAQVGVEDGIGRRLDYDGFVG
jgi:hypothetical protein